MDEVLGDIGIGLFIDEIDDNASSAWGIESENFSRMLKDAKYVLYPGYTEHNKLLFIVWLFHIQLLYGVLTKAINMVLDLFNDVLFNFLYNEFL